MSLTRSGLLPALWIGFAAGLLELTTRAVQHFLFGRLLFVGADFWWGAPLVAAVFVTVPTLLILLPLRHVLPSRHVLPLSHALPLGFGLFGLILLLPGLAKWAAALLAAGIAVQAGSWLANRSVGFERLVRRTIPVLVLLPALIAGTVHLDRGRTGTPTTAVGDPNVLLLVLDTVRAIELGLYGFKPTTSPNLDAFGAQGVVFDQAFSTAPWTAPSHAGLFTGRRANQLSIDWKVALDRAWPTLAEVLRAQGYATAGFVANTEYASAETGLARGFEHYEDYPLTAYEALRWTALSRAAVSLWNGIRRPAPHDLSGRKGAEEINRRLLGWLDRHSGRRFFAFLNYFDAHAPYFPPEPFWSRFLPGEPRRPRPVQPGVWSFQTADVGRRAYQGAIAYLDQEIGALLDSLRVRRTLRETLVIVVGDHGEEFFEHGLMGHGNSLYAPSVRVPLLLVWPGRLPSTRIAEPVSLAGVPATIMELLGKSGPFPDPSLTGFWTGRPPSPVAVTSVVSYARNLPDWYPVSHGGMASARLGRYRYLSTPRDSAGQLYDHETDPFESRNLAGDPSLAPILRALRDTVASLFPRRGRGGS